MQYPLMASCEECVVAATELAQRLGLPLLATSDPCAIDNSPYVLILALDGLQLQQTGRKPPGPIKVDFSAGAADHRRQFGGGRGQMIAKAVGLKSGIYPLVLDATAGLGGDAFVLASLGAGMLLQERNPVVHALLADGLARAAEVAGSTGDGELAAIVARMRLTPMLADSTQTMVAADVVYLDPMFPSRDKSAAVKKEMTAFHHLVGSDADADKLLATALDAARYRVVVKRPRKAPCLAQRAPSYSLEGKSSRFDIYTKHKFPASLTPSFS